ncbi:hypothetical protein H2203_005532 [Taxawa tesnikishii (nom. ined.)]|nr:hypothetical protein H2203_005532 [Dothideales sp. JES 119]
MVPDRGGPDASVGLWCANMELAFATAKAAGKSSQDTQAVDARLSAWKLTVGIEVHAELNTTHKLFSTAATSTDADPNTHVALFDAALPGAQPQFQHATLIPALRAALAMNCDIQNRSSWDRKHYFYQDQPNGYQITQYYEPFARNGTLTLTLHDGIDPSDVSSTSSTHVEPSITIGIKQIQMEQDTAKTSTQPPSTSLLDFNRVSHPLIEIITLPQIHSPATAAACVRKIQSLLRSVDACVAGMEAGGLRADVNVSVRLGTRTEIKNLSSLKAVEDAVAAERDRQIRVLEAGEVDYRYMPDPDLPDVVIGEELVQYVRERLPELPDRTVERVVEDFGVSMKDAKTLVLLDDGERLEYCASTIALVTQSLGPEAQGLQREKVTKLVANWVLHELGGLLASDSRDWTQLLVLPETLASILTNLLRKQITARSAKQLLQQIYNDDNGAADGSVENLIEEQNLRLRPLSEEGYVKLATEIMDENQAMVDAIKTKGQKGKIMWFVGQMVRRGEEGTVEAEKAREVLEGLLGL